VKYGLRDVLVVWDAAEVPADEIDHYFNHYYSTCPSRFAPRLTL
jgi:hypothetical protein